MADEPGSSAAEEIELRTPPSPARSTRRRALWGVLAVAAVAAGALAISAGGDDDGLPLLPAAVGGAGRAEGAMAADSSMLAWVRYVPDDGLPALGGEAPAYRLSGSVDEGRVRALAEVLGVEGPIEDTGDGWLVTDGRATLEVVDDGGGAWWYSITPPDTGTTSGGGSAGCEPAGEGGCAEPSCEPGPAVDCGFAEMGVAAPTTTTVCLPHPVAGTVPECSTPTCPAGADCVEPVPADKQCPPDAVCTVPTPDGDCLSEVDCTLPEPAGPIDVEPAADLPAEDDARSIALDVLAATGADVDAARITVDGPYDAWYVHVEHTVDGVPVSGWQSMVAVGPGGEVLHANGMLAQAERLGDYPLIDTRAAIDRLNEQQAVAFEGGWSPYPGMAQDTAAADPAATAPVTAPPLPCDPQLSPEEMDRCLAEGGYAIPTTSVPNPCPDDTKATDEDPASRCVDPPCIPGSVPVTETTVPGQAPETTLAPVPACDPIPLPELMPTEPEPLEVVLTEADPVLVLTVGPEGAFLVPGYRFGNADGMQVEVSAVADTHLAPSTTVPGTDPPPPATEPAPGECEVLVEDDGSGTTHTMNPCVTTTTIAASEPRPLEPGETPVVGVPYYVDVDVECRAFRLGDQVFMLDEGDTAGWSTPHEGGMFTLDTPDHGTFTGDSAGTKTATFRVPGPAEDIFCSPRPRR